MDAWRVLDIPVGSSKEEIRHAYRRLALRHHPDKNPGDSSAHGRFATLTAAYHSLIDAAFPRAHVAEVAFHGFVLRTTTEAGYARCEVLGRKGAIYPIKSASGQLFLRSPGRAKLARFPKGYAGPRNFLFLNGTLLGVIAETSLLALPVLQFDHPTIAYVIGSIDRRHWTLSRVDGDLHALNESGARVALGGYRIFTDATGALQPSGARMFPPFEALI